MTLPLPATAVPVETTAELEAAVRERFGDADVLIMAAAPSDFRPAEPIDAKLSREGGHGLSIDLEPTTDIVAAVAAGRRPDQTVIGFAAEHGDGAVERGREKLARKGLDAVVVNDISRSDIGFDSTDNEVTIVLAGCGAGGRPAVEGGGRGGHPRRGRALEDAGGGADYRRTTAMSSENAYELFKKGSELLEQGDFMAASVPLERARSLEPDKGSIREALGRAYFRSRRFDKAAEEFAAVVERYPVNDYAHFCLGRSLEKTGRRTRGPPPRGAGRPHAPGPHGLPGAREPAADGGLGSGDGSAGPRSFAAWPRTPTTASVIRPSRRSMPGSSTATIGMSPCTQMSRAWEQPKRTRRVWRFHQSSIQGSRSLAAWSASAWMRSRRSAIRRLASIGSPPTLSPGTTIPHSVWESRRAFSPGIDAR